MSGDDFPEFQILHVPPSGGLALARLLSVMLVQGSPRASFGACVDFGLAFCVTALASLL